METDILIIGAGASGLSAAYELSLVNKNFIVLEARDRIGGRIHSINDERFKGIVEAGAEFIHGELPVTNRLLEKAGIRHHRAEGKIWEVQNGKIIEKEEFVDRWGTLIKKLETLEEDMPISEFLTTYFPGEQYEDLRESALDFTEGYNAADSTRASSFALREEWENSDEQQGRLDDGYIALINYLAQSVTKRGNKILLSEVVKKVTWQKGKVEVLTNKGQHYTASKILITIPLGVWQAQGEFGHISFAPALKEKTEAAQKMGFGGVIKINMQFKNNFWEEDAPNKMNNAGFIFNDGELPTWWTQEPIKNGQLTGWIAGPRAAKLKNTEKSKIFDRALKTLAYVSGTTEDFIRENLVAHHITNWMQEEFTRGAYSYATLDSHWAKTILAQPVEQTLYFAGEALYNGTETGTVEGALTNGRDVAHTIIVHS